jgi:hypothetical protein
MTQMTLRSCALPAPSSVTRATDDGDARLTIARRGQTAPAADYVRLEIPESSVPHSQAESVPIDDSNGSRRERDHSLALELLEADVDPLATRSDG